MKKVILLFALYLIPLAFLSISHLALAKVDVSSHVIGLWHFDATHPQNDDSGNGHVLRLRGKGTLLTKDGKFGGGLLIKSENNDTPQGAIPKNGSDLNPGEAFTLEMWISPAKEAFNQDLLWLLDKKNSSDNNSGYMLTLKKSDAQFQLQAQLGFGKDSATIHSEPYTFEAKKWYHVTFTYDGKGTYKFYLNNQNIGVGYLPSHASISPNSNDLVIGSRMHRHAHPFLGRIDEVRITDNARVFSGKVLLSQAGQRFAYDRTAYYRMEKDATMSVRVFNDTSKVLKDAALHTGIAGIYEETTSIPLLAAGESTFISVPLHTNLRPGSYQISAVVQDSQKRPLGDNASFPMTIVSCPLPQRMPVIMWNHNGNYTNEELKEMGFTGKLWVSGDFDYIWKNGDAKGALKPSEAIAARKFLDESLKDQVDTYIQLMATHYASKYHPEYNELDQKGNKRKGKGTSDGLYPRIQQFASDTGVAVARTFGDMPALKGALINNEVMDHSAPSFNEVDKKAYRKFSGHDIPQKISEGNGLRKRARGVKYQSIPGFPDNRIIPDDNPILQYYKWFWKEGAGWDIQNTLIAEGLKSTGRSDLMTWYDPALRALSIWGGSSGNLDFINNWTYTNPNPIKVGRVTDELFTMTKGHPGQKVMTQVQLIWKRPQVAGTPKNVQQATLGKEYPETRYMTIDPGHLSVARSPKDGHQATWEKEYPETRYITLAPDHLSEATWLAFARPVQAIGYYGWDVIGKHFGDRERPDKSHVTTNPESNERLTYLLHNVIGALGPAMMQVPDYDTDVAFLISATSQVFAERSSWGTDAYIVARYAGLQPQIIYDKTIQIEGLSQYKVLFLMDCAVLTESEAEAIQKFQQKGGIVIGDENLAPGIKPNILMKSVERTSPQVTKEKFIQAAQRLTAELDPHYHWPLQSDNPNVITRLRQFDGSYYVFMVNDNRTYGDYVGQYKKVMEKGLPSKALIKLNTLPAGSVYDLTSHQQVPATRIQGKVQFPVSLEGGQGDMFLVTPKPVGDLQVTGDSKVSRGKSIRLKVLLEDKDGDALDAVVPLKVTVLDAKGRRAEGSGYYGAKHGQQEIKLDIAPNDVKGKWQVQVSEALTGQKVTKTFDVK